MKIKKKKRVNDQENGLALKTLTKEAEESLSVEIFKLRCKVLSNLK